MSDRRKELAISKRIADNKLKAFSIGKTNPMPKKGSVLQRREKEQEKKKLDIEETQNVFDEFVQSFEDVQTVGKTFVRSTTSNPEPTQEMVNPSKLYNPLANKPKTDVRSDIAAIAEKLKRKKGKDSRRSILESFKEELKRTQMERDERHTQKSTDRPPVANVHNAPNVLEPSIELETTNEFLFDMQDSGDPISTNLYVGNINQKMNEEMLCQVFGKFGALASVKVMWPRTDEEKARNHNCGFVAYMKRDHATQALSELKGTKLMDFPVQLGWGKPVPLPLNPVYVHPDLIKIEPTPPQLPDPPSGLPFNAQYKHDPNDVQVFLGRGDTQNTQQSKNEPEILVNSIIRVTIPCEEEVKLIHRMIEFVVREGPMFEAMIMTREINNPEFRFLFDNQSLQHVYYRWKLFSILQGDSPETWRTEDFQLFRNGSFWRPPALQPVEFPDLKPKLPEIDVVKKGCLSSRQRDELEDLLREMTLERKSICFTMGFCIDNSESSDEIIDCVTESLVILQTPLLKKVARLYLVSDIVNNSTVRIDNASTYRNGFKKHFETIFTHFASAYDAITSPGHAEHFKILVLKVLFSWERQILYPPDFLTKLKQLFLPNSDPEILTDEKILENLDGQPMENFYEPQTADIDGIPMDNELDGEPIQVQFDQEAHEAKFKPFGTFAAVENDQNIGKSKWELLDDPLDEILEQTEEQEQVQRTVKSSRTKDLSLPGGLSGSDLSDNMRRKLQDIEMKVVKFAQELQGLDSEKALGNKVNRDFMEQKIDGYRKVLLEDFYQTNSFDTEADTHPVTMDISKTSIKPSHAAKALKFFSQYTDSESENLTEENSQKEKSSKSKRSHKYENRDAPICPSRSRSYSYSDTPSSEYGSPLRGSKHRSKKSRRSRHGSSSPSETRISRKERNSKTKDKSSSRSRKRHSKSISPSQHTRVKSSKKSRHHSSDSRSPSPHKRSKKNRHH